nr:HNH endonuclease family protein [Brachybacterium sacelli]
MVRVQITRNDILTRDLSSEEYEPGTGDCEVIVGVLNDPYSGDVIEFEKSEGSSQIDIDHIVPLGAAWDAGASEWTDEERLAYANDPEVLAAVNSSDNRSKSDATIGEWMPENEDVTCQYASSYVSVSAKYDLSISPADHDVLEGLLAQCA